MSVKKILIVDDIIDNIQIIVEVFGKYSPEYVLYQSNNGKLAYDIVLKTQPDLIITDWYMPVMNGIDLLKKIKLNPITKSIPVIMATGVMTTVENLKTALDAGAVDYIRKPIDEVELVARTKAALNLADFNRRIIEKKDQELIENTLLLIRNNEFNLQVNKQLNELFQISSNAKQKELIQKIITDIDQKIKADSWQRFDTSFNAVYEEFYKNILQDFPDLTSTELKLCAFLKLGLNSKDIASIIYNTPDSVKVSRSRLRKKLNLHSKVNLQIFLSQY